MRKTLLELTQSILSSLDGEEINSISDTVESQQIVGFIKNSYEEIISGLNLPALQTVYQLDPSLDPLKPTLMYLPETASDLKWLKYDKSDTNNSTLSFQDLMFYPIEDFFGMMYGGNIHDTNVGSYTLNLPTGNTKVYYQNDKMPDRYTVLSDRVLVFDSYDLDIDTTLVSAKTAAYGEVNPVFRVEDDFVPNLTPKEFALLENEAKAQAFVEQKQSANPKAEARARKGWIRSQRQKISVPYYNNSKLHTTVDYGRQGNRRSVSKYLRNGR